jgi:hypothetical protein
MAFTVIPLHFLSLDPGTQVPFGPDFVFSDVPPWLKSDKGILQYVSHKHRELFEQSRHALVAEYDAESMGSSDPEWKGSKPRSFQQTRFQGAMLANLALWLRQPSPVCFSLCFHAVTLRKGHADEAIIAQNIDQHAIMHCNTKDRGNPVTAEHILEAATTYAGLRNVEPGNAVFTAIRFVWEALTSYRVDFRYTHFWIALEALFGPEDSGETTYKLCQRIGFFLGDAPEVARLRFKGAKKCYGFRSKIVHGRWKHDPKIDEAMEETEAIVRTSLRKILETNEMTSAFISKRRDEFLEDLVFANYGATQFPDDVA